MARSLRASPDNAGRMTLKEADKKASKLVSDAKIAARAIARGAMTEVNEKERLLEKKVKVINKLLPNGFTPAPNLEILPPEIRAKATMSAQEVLAHINPADAFLPTPAQRAMVFDYAKWGVPIADIRLRIINPLTGSPVDPITLKKYFWEEIALGQADGNTEIAKAAFQMATPRPAEYDDEGRQTKPERDPNPSVLIAISKHRLKWFENKNVVINDNRVEPELAEALKQLTPDELRTLRSFATRRADQKTQGGSEGDR